MNATDDKIQKLINPIESIPAPEGFSDGTRVPTDLRARAEADRLGFWADRKSVV